MQHFICPPLQSSCLLSAFSQSFIKWVFIKCHALQKCSPLAAYKNDATAPRATPRWLQPVPAAAPASAQLISQHDNEKILQLCKSCCWRYYCMTMRLCECVCACVWHDKILEQKKRLAMTKSIKQKDSAGDVSTLKLIPYTNSYLTILLCSSRQQLGHTHSHSYTCTRPTANKLTAAVATAAESCRRTVMSVCACVCNYVHCSYNLKLLIKMSTALKRNKFK